jgi:alpha-glucosidase
VKSGGIVPLQSVIQSTSEKPSPTLEINVYNGKVPTTFTWYEDDGVSYNYESGQYCRRQISFDPLNKVILIGKAEGSLPSKFTAFRLVLHDFGDLMGVKVNGNDQTLKLKSSKQRFFETILTNEVTKINY